MTNSTEDTNTKQRLQLKKCLSDKARAGDGGIAGIQNPDGAKEET